MPKPICISTRTAVSRAFAAGAVLAAATLALACGGKDTGGNRSPIFHTGVNASVIEPGGAMPTMPPPGLPRGASAPGQYNQSSRGGAQTSAPTQTASQGSARILPPGGGSAGSPYGPYGGAPPQHGAYGVPQQPGGAYGVPQHATPPSAGGGGGMVSIGGATTIDTRREIREMKPADAMARNPLLWPVAAVAWPFQKLSERRSGTANQSHSGGPESAPPPLSAEQLDQIHDREQTLAMERALAQRDGAAPPPQYARPALPARPPSPGPSATAPSPRWTPPAPQRAARPSIAEELAALRRGNSAPSEPNAPQVASRHDGTRARDVPSDPYTENDPAEGVRQRFDDDGDGRPDREETYDREGLLAESAEDANGDGTLDTWTRYRNGAPLRRRADLDGDGMIDAWTYYADGGLDVARLERDTTGDGYRDQIDFFDGGELARRTQDADGDGFPERVTRFGPDGRPTQRDEDSDGDGALDTRSFYEGGRLTRRILLNDDERWEP